MLFLWDYLITLGDEVEYFWGRRLTAANALFLLNRYINLVITIMQFFSTAFFQTAHVSSHLNPSYQCSYVILEVR